MKFLSKDLSIKLKERGFNGPCFGDYRYGHDNFVPFLTDGDESFEELLQYSWYIPAPTIEQALEWLREEKKIYVGVAYMPKIDDNTDFYYPTIQKIGDFEPTHFGDNDEIFNSYDDAAIAGIEYVVNKII